MARVIVNPVHEEELQLYPKKTGEFVAVSGDTMTGLLTLSGAPTDDLHAATKKYVDDNTPSITWGSITGTLSDQTDLQTELDAKVDLTGDTMTGDLILDGASLGSTGTRVTKGWFTDLEVTNDISGSITGNAETVTNATLTTALTVNTGDLTLTANADDSSVLTIGSGAVSVSGSNTGDQSSGDFDHGGLQGLGDDDHTQYVLVNGTRDMEVTTGNAFNIGLGSASGDDFTVDTNKLVVEGDSGNVGIGTTEPAGKLHLDNSGDHTFLYIDRDKAGSKTGQIRFISDGSTSDNLWRFGQLDGTNDNLELSRRYSSIWSTVMGFDITSGSVGIGTTGPGAKLHVDGDAIFDTDTGNQPFYITRTGAITQALKVHIDDSNVFFESIQDEAGGSEGGYRFYLDDGSTTPSFELIKGSTSLLKVIGNGLVGIGVTDPDTKLEVFGSTGLKISFDATDNTTLVTDTAGDFTITTSGSNLKIPQATQIGDGGTTNYANFASDGELTLEGTARVYKNQWINVQGLKAPGTKPAALVDWGISCAWEFTDGTDDTICSSIRLPQDMDRTVAPEFKIGFASATNTGDVVWQLEYIYLTPNEDTTAAAQETLTTTTTISGTSNGLTIATITGMDLPSDTDQLIKMRIKRLGADGDDDLGDDCVLVGAGLKYVADKLGVSL